ncbi:hypothetical protein FB45DRAFT_897343 [Roridomyces roridus]|uniref:FIST domain-containing protein n=1 Tax=Roridomyces roridus TaxID=1738132 RepID=A0AAD7FUN9_9AGAR|nr:hypothetical protein FB45DRAFT_897343 [Roridomyces roridus]
MHFSTILTRSPSKLLSHLSRLSYREHVVLFSLSPNVASSELAQLIQRLTTLSPQTIGCLSAPLPGHEELLSCSIGAFRPENCIPFRSQIAGRASTQVGRRHSFRHKESQHAFQDEVPPGKFDWEDVWDQSLTSNELPPALQSSSSEDIATVIYFTDAAPEGLSNALGRFPKTTKLGLLATPTPFITGRPVTLFEGDRIHGSGAVGVALKHPKAQTRVQFLDMSPLSSPMAVTQAEGNLVISLDNKNPTQLLLEAIRKSGIELSASDTLKDNDEFCLATLQNDQPHQMSHIISGDPSRGTIALRTMSGPPIGAHVQFFHRPKSTNPTIPSELTRSANPQPTLGFIATSETHQSLFPSAEDEGVQVFEGTYLAGSEGGFILSRSEEGKSETPWNCTVPGGLGMLTWRET